MSDGLIGRGEIGADTDTRAGEGAGVGGMQDLAAALAGANVLYRGRRQATVEANLTAAESGKLLAHGTSTCMLLELG